MRKTLTTVIGGIAVCLLFGGASALCQTASTSGVEAPRVASAPVQTPAAEHPLIPVIRWAEQERPKVAAIKDYTAIVQKQENINGAVQGIQIMEVKVRHQPFSVYTKFRFPKELNGQQAIYVEGKNDGKLVAHGVGPVQRAFGTQRLEPTSFLAMRGQKYPITEMGVLNLIDKLLEVGYKDSQFGECEVTYREGVPLFKDTPSVRECTVIQVVHPIPRSQFMFYMARIYVDKALNIPIRYESFDWPRAGGSPTLIEAYSYMDLKLNVGLTDLDFDPTNPAYAFP
jgi:hypothetical protein